MYLVTRILLIVISISLMFGCSDKPKRDISEDAKTFVKENKIDPTKIIPLIDRQAVAESLDKWKIPYPRNDKFTFCYGGDGCVTNKSTNISIKLPPAANDPSAERDLISSLLNDWTIKSSPAENFNATDQALNNTQMLSLMAEHGFLKYYMVQPLWQEHFWTQLYASVKEVGTGRRFIVIGNKLVETK